MAAAGSVTDMSLAPPSSASDSDWSDGAVTITVGTAIGGLYLFKGLDLRALALLRDTGVDLKNINESLNTGKTASERQSFGRKIMHYEVRWTHNNRTSTKLTHTHKTVIC